MEEEEEKEEELHRSLDSGQGEIAEAACDRREMVGQSCCHTNPRSQAPAILLPLQVLSRKMNCFSEYCNKNKIVVDVHVSIV